jgi:hypothetical protein
MTYLDGGVRETPTRETYVCQRNSNPKDMWYQEQSKALVYVGNDTLFEAWVQGTHEHAVSHLHESNGRTSKRCIHTNETNIALFQTTRE